MKRILPLAAIAAMLVVAASACACNVPVFRYALERWHPDPYRVTVFHRGPLDDAQRVTLEQVAGTSTAPTNAAVRLVDVDRIENDADRALFAAQSVPQLPWLVVQYPASLRIEQTVWAGPLQDDAAARLVVSPVRSELIKRLAAGETAVWMMLECGDKTKDDEAAAKLEVELALLATKLKLPELTSAPEDELLSDAPLAVKFSLLRVPRENAAEQPLVELLLHAEPDLYDFAEPMVFPVFGRGRCLLPLIGAGINADVIHESAAFLVGACSCEIKELNPGFDLLLAVDWNVLLFKSAVPPEAARVRTVAAGEPELVAIPSGAKPTDAAPSPIAAPTGSALEFEFHGVGIRSLAAISAAVVAIVGALGLFLSRRA